MSVDMRQLRDMHRHQTTRVRDHICDVHGQGPEVEERPGQDAPPGDTLKVAGAACHWWSNPYSREVSAAGEVTIVARNYITFTQPIDITPDDRIENVRWPATATRPEELIEAGPLGITAYQQTGVNLTITVEKYTGGIPT